MKKFLIAVTTVLTLTTTVFAKDKNQVNAKAERNFTQEFNTATNVEWTATSKFSKATFTLEDKKCTAFYDLQGNFIANSFAISLNDLPTYAKRAFAKKYGGYTVKEAIQLDTATETSYYISAENDRQNVVLQCSEGFITFFSKSAKN